MNTQPIKKLNPILTKTRVCVCINLIIVLSGFLSTLNAQSVLVTIAETSVQQSSTLSDVNVFTFNDMPNGNYSNVVWNSVGTFDELMIHETNAKIHKA